MYNNIEPKILGNESKYKKINIKEHIIILDKELQQLPSDLSNAYFNGTIKGGAVKKGNVENLLNAVIDCVILEIKSQTKNKHSPLDENISKSVKSINNLLQGVINESGIEMTPIIYSIQGILNEYYKQNI